MLKAIAMSEADQHVVLQMCRSAAWIYVARCA